MNYKYVSFVVVSLLALASAGADTRTVTSIDDHNDGVCDADCTLREAIAASLINDTIAFAASLNGATIGLNGTELGVSRNLTIIGPSGGVTVSGNSNSRVFNILGGAVRMSNLNIVHGKVSGMKGADATSFSDAQPGGSESGAGILNLGTLTLTNCRVSSNLVYGGNGGNGYASTNTESFGLPGGEGFGGGIANEGSLTLVNCSVSENFALGGVGGITYDANSSGSSRSGVGGSGRGGGIYNKSGSTLVMTGCAVNYNNAYGQKGGNGANFSYGADGSPGFGGGLDSAGTTTLKNCTVNGNEAAGGSGGARGPNSSGFSPDGQGGSGYGGGIHGNSVTLINCTLAGNTAKGGAGGGASGLEGYVEGGGLSGFNCSLRNTILAGNSITGRDPVGPDVKGNMSSQGHNFIGNTGDNGDGSVSGGWVASDIKGTAASPLSPQLGPLQDNGGPTETMALSPGSGAIDHGDDAVLAAPFNISIDQRGIPRKVGTHVDIGAYELDPPQTGTAFVVNTTHEHSDGVCGLGDCSLWDAVAVANAASDANIISFKPGLSGTITTKLQATGINLMHPVTINGPGARTLTLSGANSARIFTVASSATATITGLTLANGRSTNGGGGGILNGGELTLIDCAVLNNKDDSGDSAGGGVFNVTTKTLTITNCTFANNQSSRGGAVANAAGSVVMTNSTLSGNTAGRGGALATGSGFPNDSLTLRSCTITGNHATEALNGYGGGFYNGVDPGDLVNVVNTLIAGNTATTGSPDIFGPINSQDYNLIGNTSGATIDGTTAHNITNVNPNLNSLANNGGPTNTHALRSNSAAINAGNNANAPLTDQRGYARNGNTDIGAFEASPGIIAFNNVIYQVNEGVGTITFNLVRTGGSDGAVSAVCTTSNGTAQAGNDYVAKTATVSFASGQTAKTFTVAITDDALDEANETFTVTLSNPAGGATLGAPLTRTGTILDNDALPLLSINNVIVTEGNTGTLNATFAVTLNKASGRTVTVNYATANGTAAAGSDYTAGNGTLTFAPGQTSRTLNVAVKGDTLDEPNETFRVNLSGPVNATISDSQGVGTITDNDPPPTGTPSPTPTPNPTATATPTPKATPTATPKATPTPTPQTVLANISTRLKVETGDNTLIGGFIITGTQPKKVIIRAIGPSLSLPAKLANPTLELRNSAGFLLKANDDWKNSSVPDRQAIIDSTIPPTNDLESAIVATLPANGASYTAIVRGVNNTTGIGVVEMYDLDRNVDSKLANISTRGLVQKGDTVLIAGTIVLGPSSQKVIIRAIGPSLNIAGKLANPTLELRNASGTLLDANDNWKNSANKQAIINSTVPPTNDLESAIVATLPGNGASYTAIVRGVNNTTGIAVVEVYALQ